MAHPQEELVRSPSVWHPAGVEEAWRIKREKGAAAAFVAGGTLLRTQWEAGTASCPAHLIDLTAIPGLDGIADEDAAGWRIGALATLAECRSHAGLGAAYPLLADAARVIAAPAVRNLATIGGNVLSRTGDMATALLALDAELAWQGDAGLFFEPLSAWLDRERGGLSGAPGLLVHITLPASMHAAMNANAKRICAFHKVGRREAFIPPVVNVAMTVSIGADGVVADVRLAAGGGAMIPARLAGAEALLLGRKPDAALLGELHAVVLGEYRPMPDPFVTEDYRKMTAANLAASALWQACRNAGGQGEEAPPCC